MSLFKPAEGLFETHLTLSKLKEDIQHHFGDDELVNDCTVERITVDEGNASRIGHVNVTTSQGKYHFMLKVPTCLRVGVTDNEALVKLYEDSISRAHNREIDFFEKVFSKIEGVKVPRMIAAHRFDDAHKLDAYILMEFVENSSILRAHEFAGVEGTKQLVAQLAQVHASALVDKEVVEKHFDCSFFSTMYNFYLSEERIKTSLDDLEKFIGGDHTTLFDTLRNNLKSIANPAYYFGINEKLSCPPVLIHGDMWSGNIMWSRENNLTGILDWQCARLGNPGEDLSRMFCWSLSPEDRKKHWKNILSHYYDCFVEYLKKEGLGEVPFTFQQVVRGYKLTLPTCAIICLPYVPGVFEQQSKGTDDNDKETIGANILSVMEEVAEIIAQKDTIENLESKIEN